MAAYKAACTCFKKEKKKSKHFFFSLSLRKRPKFDIVFLAFVKICSIGKTLHNHRPIYECESACIPAPHVANVIAYVCINFKNILSMEIHIQTFSLMLDFHQYKKLSFVFFFLQIFSYVRLRQAEPVSTAVQRQQHTLACLQAPTVHLLVKDLAGVLCYSHLLVYIFRFLLQIKTQSEEERRKSGKVNFLL